MLHIYAKNVRCSLQALGIKESNKAAFPLHTMADNPEVICFLWKVRKGLRDVPSICGCVIFGSVLNVGSVKKCELVRLCDMSTGSDIFHCIPIKNCV